MWLMKNICSDNSGVATATRTCFYAFRALKDTAKFKRRYATQFKIEGDKKMKTDRFVKVMLVIIAGLLLLNCFKDNGGGISDVFGTKAKATATAPAFLEKGKTYRCYSNVGLDYEILEVDKESGWIKANYILGANPSTEWINTANLNSCKVPNAQNK